MQSKGVFSFTAGQADAGGRLDYVVACRIDSCSRSIVADLIRNKKILVHGKTKKTGYRVKTGDKITGLITSPKPLLCEEESIPINILYEDEHVIVVNKPPGIVVYPAPGHCRSTLVNGLLYYCPQLKGIGEEPRPGIVHRLDKDTSGVLVVAKSADSYKNLAWQFKTRKIKKKYIALVYGKMKSESGAITLPVGRHPVDRKKMSVIGSKGRFAETSWKVKEYFSDATLIELNIKTGRTHQIRVHCAAIKHPVIGDFVYSGRKLRRNFTSKKDVSNKSKYVPRQMLHAWRLEFIHPETRKAILIESPIPQDMAGLIKELRNKY